MTAARVLGGRPATARAARRTGPPGGGAPRTAAAGLHGGSAAPESRALGFSVFGSRVMSSVPQVRQPFVLFCELPVSSFLPIFRRDLVCTLSVSRVLRLLGS